MYVVSIMSPRIFGKFEMTLMIFSGTWEKKINEKTWSKKSRDTVPLIYGAGQERFFVVLTRESAHKRILMHFLLLVQYLVIFGETFRWMTTPLTRFLCPLNGIFTAHFTRAHKYERTAWTYLQKLIWYTAVKCSHNSKINMYIRYCEHEQTRRGKGKSM